MEHIVQFGISIDDETIKKTIEKKALQSAIEDIKKDMASSLGVNTKFDWYSKIGQIAKEHTEKFLENNRETIISMTADRLADKLWKTKQVKERVNAILHETLGE